MTAKPQLAGIAWIGDGEPMTTVEECRLVMEQLGLSQAAAAKEVGISPTALSQWLAGKYPGDAPAVEAQVGRWLQTRREAARREALPPGLDAWRDLEASAEVLAVLAHAHAAAELAIVGGPRGCGKTRALRRYGATRSGVVQVAMSPAVTTLAGCLRRVAGALGWRGRGASALDMEDAAIERLTGRGALLAVDEADHLGPRLLDELRCLAGKAGCGLALVGADHGRLPFDVQARSVRAIQARAGLRLAMTAPSKADAAAFAAGVLGRRPTAGEAKAVAAAAAGPRGLFGARDALARAWLLARHDGRDAIAAEDLAAASREIAA